MAQLPLRTAISNTYPQPSNATARIGFGALWDAVSEAFEAPEVDVASASTCAVGAQLSTKVRITGTTTITSFGTTYRGPILIRMAGIVTITHNSTTLRCPGSTNILTAANDVLIAWPTATTSGTTDGWQVVPLARATGLLGISEGGTGSGTAAGAFTAIKQAGSSTATGVWESATDAEAQAGTDATRCVTPDNLGATVLGMGQTRQNLIASRIAWTNYTNSTGRPIEVNVALETSVATTIRYVVGGITGIGSSYGAAGGTTYASFIVQNGETYQVSNNTGTSGVEAWLELR